MLIKYIIFMFARPLALIFCSQIQHELSNDVTDTPTTSSLNNTEVTKNKELHKQCVLQLKYLNYKNINKIELINQVRIFSLAIENHLKLIEEIANIQKHVLANLNSSNENPIEKEITKNQGCKNNIPQNKSLDLSTSRKRVFVNSDVNILPVLPKIPCYFLEEKNSYSCSTKEFIESIEKDIKKIFHKNKWETYSIEKFMKSKIKKLSKYLLINCIDFIIKCNDKYLYVIVQGLLSFVVGIKDNTIDFNEDDYSKILFCFIVLKELSEDLKRLIGICGEKRCLCIKLKPKYVYIVDEMNEVFIKILNFSNIKESYMLLYQFLIYAEKKYRYPELTHIKPTYYKFTISLVFDPIFTIIFQLDKKTIIKLFKKHACVTEFHFMYRKFDENILFLGIFKDKLKLQEVYSLLDNYERVFKELEAGICDKTQRYRKFKEIRLKKSEEIKKVCEEISKDFDGDHGKTWDFHPILYDIFLYSKMMELFKISHNVHFDRHSYCNKYKVFQYEQTENSI